MKRIVAGTPFYAPIRELRDKFRNKSRLREWRDSGRPSPPPHIVKQRVLLAHARQFGLRTLVETGTFHGDMIHAMRRHFDRIHSIELSPELHARATVRFKNQKHVNLIRGDSAVELGKLVRSLTQPALFWLDGHFSAGETARGDKDTPVLEELDDLLASPLPHIMIIDDARCFGTDPTYPTIDAIRQSVASRRPDLAVFVSEDSIRIVPNGTTSPTSD